MIKLMNTRCIELQKTEEEQFLLITNSLGSEPLNKNAREDPLSLQKQTVAWPYSINHLEYNS